MSEIAEKLDQAVWRRPSIWKQHYQLTKGDEILASIKRKTGSWKVRGIVQFDKQSIEVNKSSILKVKWTLNQDGKEIGVLSRKIFKEFVLELQGGREYFWVRDNLWGSSWKWLNAKGELIMYLHRTQRVWQIKDQIEIAENDMDDFLLQLLSCIGYFALTNLRSRFST